MSRSPDCLGSGGRRQVLFFRLLRRLIHWRMDEAKGCQSEGIVIGYWRCLFSSK